MSFVDLRLCNKVSTYRNAVWDASEQPRTQLPKMTETYGNNSNIINWACVDCGRIETVNDSNRLGPPKWCSPTCKFSTIAKLNLVEELDWMYEQFSGIPGPIVELAWSGELNYVHQGKDIVFDDAKDPMRIFRFPASALFMSQTDWTEHGTFPPEILELSFRAEIAHFGSLIEVRKSPLDGYCVYAVKPILKNQSIIGIWGSIGWNSCEDNRFLERFSHSSCPRDRLLEADVPICAKSKQWLEDQDKDSTVVFLHMHDLGVCGRINSSKGAGPLVYVCQRKESQKEVALYSDEYLLEKDQLVVLFEVRMDAPHNVVFDHHPIFDDGEQPGPNAIMDWNYNMPVTTPYLLRSIMNIAPGQELLAPYDWQTNETRRQVEKASELLKISRKRKRETLASGAQG
jgi:hypothetical protein